MNAASKKKPQDISADEREPVAYASFNELARAMANGDESAVQLSESNAIRPTVVVDGEELRVEAMHIAQSSDRTVYVLVVMSTGQPPAVVEDRAPDALPLNLTRREREIAELLADRRTNDEIAATLGISRHTARNHVQQILGKLGVSSRREVGQMVFCRKAR